MQRKTNFLSTKRRKNLTDAAAFLCKAFEKGAPVKGRKISNYPKLGYLKSWIDWENRPVRS